jgi:hypothetical protein
LLNSNEHDRTSSNVAMPVYTKIGHDEYMGKLGEQFISNEKSLLPPSRFVGRQNTSTKNNARGKRP